MYHLHFFLFILLLGVQEKSCQPTWHKVDLHQPLSMSLYATPYCEGKYNEIADIENYKFMHSIILSL